MLFRDPLTIYIISPQPWDGLKVSKHHYAHELSQLGHAVFFIEPPGSALGPRLIEIRNSDIPGLRIVAYRTWFPYALKFHARPLFNRAMRSQAVLLKRAIGAPPDLVWDFDNAFQFSDLRVFGAPFSLFHPVDDFDAALGSAKHADAVLSVSQNFIDKISALPSRVAVIPHGLSRVHTGAAEWRLQAPLPRASAATAVVGYVGNLNHAGIDWLTIEEIALVNESAMFRFFGPYATDAGGAALNPAINRLKATGRCVFEGEKSAAAIVEASGDVDIWMICYDPAKTVDGATNSHKVLEYFATGRPVLSNRLAAYANSDLLVMPDERANAGMPALLSDLLTRLDELNEPTRQAQRARHALAFTYQANLRRIDKILTTEV